MTWYWGADLDDSEILLENKAGKEPLPERERRLLDLGW